MSKQIISGNDALTKILSGVNLIANAVKATLGPSGRNCVYERLGTNLPVSTRDGVTVAEQIESADPHENMGVNLIKGVAREAVDQSGDGTTTATLLAQAIFSEGVKAITVGANPVALKRGIEKATVDIVKALKGMAIPVSGPMLRQVATISANNDPFLGGLIADAIERAGADGVVTVEVSQSPESSLSVVEGMQIGTGYISNYFITNAERSECVLEDVAILLFEKRLTAITPLREKILAKLVEEKKSLLIIAEDVTDEALAVLSISAQKGPLRCCAVKSPGSVEHLHDLAALTGARVVEEVLGVKLQNIGPDFLGYARRVVVKAQTTTIIAEKSERLEKRLVELRAQVTAAAEEGQRLRLQSRLARLASGIAVIRVGAATELEMNERKDRIEDALHATRCAEKEGVLPGGGIALLRASFQKEPICNLTGDEAAGVNIVMKACTAPIRTLAENCGESPDYILKQVTFPPPTFDMSKVDMVKLGAAITAERGKPGVIIPFEKVSSVDEDFYIAPNYGWNARTNEYGDLMEMGVIDPLRVVRVALESASSVASLMLITHTIVSNDRK